MELCVFSLQPYILFEISTLHYFHFSKMSSYLFLSGCSEVPSVVVTVKSLVQWLLDVRSKDEIPRLYATWCQYRHSLMLCERSAACDQCTLPVGYWWNFFTPKMMANTSLSSRECCFSVSDIVLEANAMGCSELSSRQWVWLLLEHHMWVWDSVVVS